MMISLQAPDSTVDDVGQREVWEENYTLIGQDLLTENEHTFYKYTPKVKEAYEEWKVAPPYRPKGGFNCWVLYGVNRKPKYYFPKRLIWIDKLTHLIIREEQYDKHGNLWKIYDYGWYNKKHIYNPDAPDIPTNRYFQRNMWNIMDLKINHRTFIAIYNTAFDKDSFLSYTGGDQTPPHSFFDVKRLEREEWGRPVIPPPPTKSMDEVVPIPRLRREVFKQYRPIVLPEELEKKLIEEYGE